MGIQSDQLIIVIESGPEDLSILVEGLCEIGVNNPIEYLGSGQAAQDYFFHPDDLCEVTGTPTPALILLDLQLLDMKGQQLLTMLRRIPSLQTILIIVFTSSQNQEVTNECYELGANSCILKPQTSGECVPILTSLLDYWGQVIAPPQPHVSVTST